VALLISTPPHVAAEQELALEGGATINPLVMPLARLSLDTDLYKS
jgi:hypothetical protein